MFSKLKAWSEKRHSHSNPSASSSASSASASTVSHPPPPVNPALLAAQPYPYTQPSPSVPPNNAVYIPAGAQAGSVAPPPYPGPPLSSSSGVVIQPPPATQVMSSAMQLFKEFADKFKIRNDFLAKLRALGDVKVVMMLDDSTSMNADAYGEEFLTDPFEQIPSRFSELKSMVHHIIDMAGILSKDPVDAYFLNRTGRLNIRTFAEIEPLFQAKPTGLTPTVRTLRYLIDHLRPILSEKKIVLFLATDGQPTNDNGDIDVNQLDKEIDLLMHTFPNLYITFMAAVSDENLLEVMDKYGEKYERIGVVDAFRVEKKEQMEKHKDNPQFVFTSGDYITKALLCALNPEIKALFKDTESDEEDEGGKAEQKKSKGKK